MTKLAEQKALEAYPILFSERNGHNNSFKDRRESYIKGYDQAIQDLLKDANKYMFLSDEIGYAYASGCRKTMQDFLEKACEWLSKQPMSSPVFWTIEDFKNYMQDEN